MSFSAPERVTEAWLMSSQRIESRPAGPAVPETAHPRAFSIAVSREAGTRGNEIAQAVGERLKWAVYDHELLELIAGSLNIRVKLLESIDERHVSWLQESVEAFCNAGTVRESRYVRYLVETLLSLAARGRCVVLGRGSPFVMPASTTVRVRLVAPLEERVAVVRSARGLSRHEAERYIETTDRERAEFVRLHFLHQPSDAAFYDLVLNTSRFSVAECADLTIDALVAKQHATPVHAAM